MAVDSQLSASSLSCGCVKLPGLRPSGLLRKTPESPWIPYFARKAACKSMGPVHGRMCQRWNPGYGQGASWRERSPIQTLCCKLFEFTDRHRGYTFSSGHTVCYYVKPCLENSGMASSLTSRCALKLSYTLFQISLFVQSNRSCSTHTGCTSSRSNAVAYSHGFGYGQSEKCRNLASRNTAAGSHSSLSEPR